MQLFLHLEELFCTLLCIWEHWKKIKLDLPCFIPYSELMSLKWEGRFRLHLNLFRCLNLVKRLFISLTLWLLLRVGLQQRSSKISDSSSSWTFRLLL